MLFIGNYCCTRVLLYAKMLKETEAEETRLFCQIFVIGGISIGPVCLGYPPGYAYDFEIKNHALKFFLKKTFKTNLK